MTDITFRKLAEREYPEFREDVKRIFSIAVLETFGDMGGTGEIIPDQDIDASLCNPECKAFAVYDGHVRVGGVVVRINTVTQHNWIELFYVYPGMHGKGLGRRILQGLEREYPETKVWRLITPYFEKRNIHFYVNKCGFKIVEFFNKFHRDSSRPSGGSDFHDEYFIFEKIMK